MLLLMLIQVIVGAVSAAARPSLGEIFEASNNVPDLPEPSQGSEPKSLVKKYLSKRGITCNDGSPSGFYIRQSETSSRWIIYLDGGWYCFDQRTCHDRYMNQRHLMSSKLWPPTRTVEGILSTDAVGNPYYWNANHVFVPYCTSDLWSGTRRQGIPGSRFSFLGAKVVRQVILDLLPMGLVNGSSLFFVGSSAGAVGVLLNLNSVQSLIHSELGLQHIQVRGMADSGWFLDSEPFSVESNGPMAGEAVVLGFSLWHSKVPSLCAAQYPFEPSRCVYGYRIYPHLTAPLFVFQWLFDEAQMTLDNVGTPVTKHQWDYIHKEGDRLRRSFQNVSAVFAPSCISHTVLSRKDWHTIRIGDVSLPEAMHCWETSLEPAARPLQDLYLLSNPNSSTTTTSMLSDAPSDGGSVEIYRTVEELLRKVSEGKRRRKHHKKKLRSEQRAHGRKKRKRQGRKNKNRLMRSPFVAAVTVDTTREVRVKSPLCHRHRFIERCTWPQCNPSCPKLHNPFTGEEMDFIELLKSFGLDMVSVANALGVDIHTLNNMDHTELLNLLTQQSN